MSGYNRKYSSKANSGEERRARRAIRGRKDRELPIEKFIIHCRDGKLDKAKTILSEKLTSDVDISNYAKAFNLACRNGRIEVAQWILDEVANLSPNDILKGFESSCALNRLDIVQWLCPVAIRAFPEHEDYFQSKCEDVEREVQDIIFEKKEAIRVKRAIARERKEIRQREISAQLNFAVKPFVDPLCSLQQRIGRLPGEISRYIYESHFDYTPVAKPVIKNQFRNRELYHERIPSCECDRRRRENYRRGCIISISCSTCDPDWGRGRDHIDGRDVMKSDAIEYIKAGGDPNVYAQLTNLPLPIFFCKKGHIDIVEKLIDAGADIHLKHRNHTILTELFRRVTSNYDHYFNERDNDYREYCYGGYSDDEDDDNCESFESIYLLIKKIIRKGGNIDLVDKADFDKFISICWYKESIPKLTRANKLGYKEHEGLDFFDSKLLRTNERFIEYLKDLKRSNKCGKYIRTIIDRFIEIV